MGRYLWGALTIDEREYLRHWAGFGPATLASVGAIVADGGEMERVVTRWIATIDYAMVCRLPSADWPNRIVAEDLAQIERRRTIAAAAVPPAALREAIVAITNSDNLAE